eukprot:CAMPEP_0195301682 /NCGR_PEP_ID=MMETSP0707-20130614/29745_1 /TAXON_ID=33640 /ORGANISM="Asterionellopsis glacialis, Strain CCMP134" /LENGTH=489 /DNA_ID=CAMNT_0040364709 /DNA_START=119 /DNA_END=1588 /DNA_ORIENTATION=-
MQSRWSEFALLLVFTSTGSSAFAPLPALLSPNDLISAVSTSYRLNRHRPHYSTFFNQDDNDIFDDDEDDDDDDDDLDPYQEAAKSEFLENGDSSSLLAPKTSIDWGGALGKLRERVGDQESGESQKPSNALYRLMTSQTPNEAISTFVSSANPQVVTAMSGAVSSLLGGLSSPAMGVETVVKASGEKIGNLCFQLQMTGYMFRNAEYVLALKDLMSIDGSATLEDFRDAFDRIDTDGSGYIESTEIESLFEDVYEGDSPPAFEVDTFMNFFDSNNDGRISWKEFERGLGAMSMEKAAQAVNNNNKRLLPPNDSDRDDDDEEDVVTPEPSISGKIQVELKDGKVIEVEAKDYINDLKREAEALKEALRKESGQNSMSDGLVPGSSMTGMPEEKESGSGISGYISSLGGDLKTLTEGISPDVVDAMKLLVDFVIEGGPGGKRKGANSAVDKDQLEMEIPGSALQQLALWQLVLGYRLREAEATGEYLRLLE